MPQRISLSLESPVISSARMIDQLRPRLLSQFTSFIAVDSMVITEGDRGVTVPVPVTVPQGVEYSTTVGSTIDR